MDFSDKSKARKEFRNAQQAYDRGDYRSATDHAIRSLDMYHTADAYMLLAQAAEKRSDPILSILQFYEQGSKAPNEFQKGKKRDCKKKITNLRVIDEYHLI